MANIDIIFVQETHCTKKDKKKWGDEWGGQNWWSTGSKNSRGVAILCNPKFKYDIDTKNMKIDNNGRYIVCDLTHGDKKFRLINIYAPNNEYARVSFFVRMRQWFDPNLETFCAGDYNCTLNDTDRLNCIGSNDVGRIDLQKIIRDFHLEDVYKRRYPLSNTFSFRRGNKASRLDYWLISKTLDNTVDEIKYEPCLFSDHYLVTIKINTSDVEHGEGVWKMNASILTTDLFKVSFESMWNHWKSQKDTCSNLSEWWDLGKKKIKEVAVWCSKKLNKDQNKKIKELEKFVNKNDTAVSFCDQNRLCMAKRELKSLYEEKSNGVIVRSRVKWHEEGETSSKFFHDLEKVHSKNKSIDKMLDKNNVMVYGTDNVQKVQVDFYKDLFKSESVDQTLKTKFLNAIDTKLPEDLKEMLDADISIDELGKCLKMMKNNKSPGPDGICTEFYKCYWNVIKSDLYDVYIYCFESGELTYSQYLALIVLLYKKGIREDITNWRPISLINIDAKLLSKVFAQRVKLVLPVIIHKDQKGCVHKRLIGQNIRLIDDVINEMDDENVDLQIDQMKAFDRIEWNWLFDVLKAFNFGEKFISWIKIMYFRLKSCIMTNGFISPYFSVSRGIRQGDCLSALLYVIQAEPLAEFIRKSNDVKGIVVKDCNSNERELKCADYVDDASRFLRDSSGIDVCMKLYEEYGKVSGSKINKEKTVGLSNNIRLNNSKLYDVRITNGPEKCLGIPMGINKKLGDFWDKIITKMTNRLGPWRMRNLTIFGKIHIVKSIALSIALYAVEMTNIDIVFVERIKKLIWDFIWKGKRVIVKHNVCMLPRNLGGLGIPDFNVLIKVRRIKTLISVISSEPNESWSILAKKYIKSFDRLYNIDWFVLRCTDSSRDVNNSNIPVFYKECILYFQELCRLSKCINQDQIIWCNSSLTFLNDVLSFKHWSKDGLVFLSDVLDSGNMLLENIEHKLRFKAAMIFEVAKLKVALRDHLGKDYSFQNKGETRASLDDICNFEFCLPSGNKKKLTDLSSSDLYEILTCREKIEIRSLNYWRDRFPNFDFKLMISNMFMCKSITRKCLFFNWRIFHGQIFTESALNRMNLSDGICLLCNDREDVTHLLITCPSVQYVWNEIEKTIKDIKGQDCGIGQFQKLFGFFDDSVNSELCNILLSTTRWLIWKRRCLFKKESEFMPQVQLVNWIMNDYKSHLKVLLKCKDSRLKDEIRNFLN